MKKLIVALLALSAFAAVAASGASGLEWLCNGKALTGTEKCLVVSENLEELRLEDMNNIAPASVTCKVGSVLDEGWVGPGALDETTLVEFMSPATECKPSASAENLKGEHVANKCEKVLTVVALNLPWKSEIAEKEGTNNWWVTILTGGNGEPGYLVECDVLGAPTDDTCLTNGVTNSVLVLAENLVEGALLLVSIFFNLNPLSAAQAAKCSATGTAEEGLVIGESLIENPAGEVEIS